MKTKSRTEKPTERRSQKEITKRAAEKKRKMEQRSSNTKTREKVKEAEVKDAEVKDGIQLIVPKSTETETIVNEDDQKRIVNQPLRDDESITGEEK